MAYYLLTGQLVFEADTPMKMFVQHLQTRAGAALERTELPIPRELDALVLACLEKDPKQRPRTPAELLRLIDECRTGRTWGQRRRQAWWDDALSWIWLNRRHWSTDESQGRAAAGFPSTVGALRGMSTRTWQPCETALTPQRKSWLDRLLSVFADVRAGEGATAVLMLVNIFLLLICYSVIKTVREPLILLGGGAEVRSYAAAGQALLLMGFVPLYSWFASRVDRARLLVGVTLFFIVCIELFAAAVVGARAVCRASRSSSGSASSTCRSSRSSGRSPTTSTARTRATGSSPSS